MHAAVRTLPLALALLAGCVGNGTPNAPAATPLLATERSLAHDLTLAVPAGQVWHLDFQTKGGSAAYDFQLTDSSTVDIGFMRTQNVRSYASGSTANFYGGHFEVQSATGSTTLDQDAWSLVIHCRNSFADCDGILNSASYWST